MADTTTELEVLDQIVEVLGGQSGQHKTVVPVLEDIRDLLGGGAGGSGYNPSLSVGRADALTGADSTAQWITRESAGSGAATVRSVQGAAVGWNQLVQAIDVGDWRRTANAAITISEGVLAITASAQYNGANYRTFEIVSGHKYLLMLDYKIPTSGSYIAYTSTSAYFNNIFSETGDNEWHRGASIITTNTDSATGVLNFQDNNAADWATWYIKNVMLFDLTQMFGAGNEPTTVAEFERMYPAPYYPYSAPTLKPVRIAGIASTDAQGGELDAIEWTAQTLRAAGSVADVLYSDHVDVKVGERAYQSGDESDATVRTDGTTTYYPLATPTTTPISPALPMTYKVQTGGSESVIVPAGEVSAAPLLTVAEGESAAELVMDALACIAAPDGPVATANHAINTYLTYNGKLYKVTSAIAVGETIVAGTNVTATTVMDEILALN